MNKRLKLVDNIQDQLYDKCDIHYTGMRGVVTFRNHETGEVIWKGRNKVILPGAEFLALSLFVRRQFHSIPCSTPYR